MKPECKGNVIDMSQGGAVLILIQIDDAEFYIMYLVLVHVKLKFNIALYYII